MHTQMCVRGPFTYIHTYIHTGRNLKSTALTHLPSELFTYTHTHTHIHACIHTGRNLKLTVLTHLPSDMFTYTHIHTHTYIPAGT